MTLVGTILLFGGTVLATAFALFVAAIVYVRGTNYGRGAFPPMLRNVNQSAMDIQDLSGKVIIVTGSSAGLGKSAAKHFAGNGATTIMACRSKEKALKAKNEIISEIRREKNRTLRKMYAKRFKESNLVVMEVDLGSLASVKQFATAFKEKYSALHSLVLNAGIMTTPFYLTEDGIEAQIGVNHFGHFYMTTLLLPELEAAQPSTVVSVTSAGHFYTYDEGVKLSLKDLNDENNYDTYQAYGQSKLANILFAQELSERMKAEGKQIYVNALHPGGVISELIRDYGMAMHAFYEFCKWVPNTFLYTPDFAALSEVYLAVNAAVFEKKVQGKYFVPIADLSTPSVHAENKNLQEELWKFTEDVLEKKGFA